MKGAIALLLILGFQSRSSDTQVRVMTYNIRYGTANDGLDRWEVRKDRLLKVLRDHHPDLLGVQEALDGQLKDIENAFPEYKALGVAREDGKADGEYSAIVYDARRLQAMRTDTFWLSDTPEAPGSRTWGNANVRVCTWAYFRDTKTGKFFYHFNTHLDHVSQPSREKSVRAILDRIAKRQSSDPVVVTGDFNVGEDNPVVKWVQDIGLKDTFRLLNPTAKTVGTFSGFDPSTQGENKIDYVFVTSRVKVLASGIVTDKVDGRWPSDHLPVTATIEFE